MSSKSSEVTVSPNCKQTRLMMDHYCEALKYVAVCFILELPPSEVHYHIDIPNPVAMCIYKSIKQVTYNVGELACVRLFAHKLPFNQTTMYLFVDLQIRDMISSLSKRTFGTKDVDRQFGL
jgi:hypothetical protein